MGSNISPRKGCRDMWNAFMVKGCIYTDNDIPKSNSKGSVPSKLVGWDEAKAIHKKRISAGDLEYHERAFIHWYMDDQKFDGNKSSIWLYPEKAFDIIRHFDGAISPDFSTNADFPKALKLYNFYRMRAYDYWLSSRGIQIVYNVRWGTEETWDYCWDGIPQGSVISIGTVASGIKNVENRLAFEEGLFEMERVLKPSTIIVYGSSKYKCFDLLREKGVEIVTFPSKTSERFLKGGRAK